MQLFSPTKMKRPIDVWILESEKRLQILYDNPHKRSTSIHYNIALQSIRYAVCLRATGAITTSAFLIARLITEGDTRLLVDLDNVKSHEITW